MLNDLELQKHGNEDWPECWLTYRRAEVVVQTGQKVSPDRLDCGELVTVKGEMIRYRCLCGSLFERVAGDNNEEAQMWVDAHKQHVTDPAQIETAVCGICIPEAGPSGIKTGCMQRKGEVGANAGWLCNGRGHLMRRKSPLMVV